MTFEQIKQRGTRDDAYRSTGVSNTVQCRDGFTMSVIAGGGAYASPREGGGPYKAVEMGFPSERPEPWDVWQERAESPGTPTETVYGWVPVYTVQALIDLHGGER